MDDWAKALAEVTKAEGELYGENVIFRNKNYKITIGSTQQALALQSAGYLPSENLTAIFANHELLGLGEVPKINEVLVIRGQVYRITQVRKLEQVVGYELQCEFVPDLVPEEVNEPIYFTPLPPSNIVSALLANLPIEVEADLLSCLPPSEVEADKNPVEPSNVEFDIAPISPSNLIVGIIPVSPDNVEANSDPIAPSDVNSDTTPLAPDNIQSLSNPLAPSDLTLESSPFSPDQLVLNSSPFVPDNISVDSSPISPSNLTLDSSPLLPDQVSVLEIWTPNKITTEGWWDASDDDTITKSGSEVTRIDDKSGNNLNLEPLNADGPTIGNITLNGYNVLEWDSNISTDQILENNSFAWDQANTPIYFSIIYKLIDDGVTSGDQDFLVSGTESSTRISFRRRATDQYEILCTGGNLITSNTFPESNDPKIVTAKFGGASSFIRVNGTEEASGGIGNVAFSSLNLGGNYAESANLEGFIAECLFFTNASEYEKVEGYLAHKWNVASILPNSHTYKSTAP